MQSRKVSTFEEMEELIEKRYPYFNRKYCQLGDELTLYKLPFVSLKRTLSANDRIGLSEIGVQTNNGWVNSQAINAYFYVLSLRSTHFAFNTSEFWSTVAERNPQNYAEIMAKLDVIKGKTHYAVPISYNSHWIVAIYRLDLRQWSLLNSEDAAPAPPFLLAGLSYLAQMIQQKMGQPNVKMTFVSRIIQTQKDEYNCGVFICWYVNRFVLNLKMYDIAFSPDQFRIEIFNAIVEHC